MSKPTEKAQRTKKIIHALAEYFKKQSQLITKTALFEGELTEEEMVNIAPNGKPYRTYNKSEILEDLGLKRGSRQLDKVVQKLGLDPANSPFGGQWTVNLPQRNDIKRAFNSMLPFERKEGQKLAVFVSSNLKGGSGKTTMTTLSATGLAVEGQHELRIGVIDLDPQGTATRILLPKVDVSNEEADYLSVGDLIIHDRLDYETAEEYKEIVKESFLPTNYPNLRVLPANANDFQFELQSKLDGTKVNGYASYQPLQRLLDQVADDFDVIFIDTPPALNEISIAAHYVGTHVLIPLRASENDRDSTSKYLSRFDKIYDFMLQFGHKGYEAVKLVPSAIDRRSPTEINMELNFNTGITDFVTSSIPSNEAIKNTNEDLNTLFDVSPSCYAGTKKTCANAQIALLPFIKNIEGMLATYWKTGVSIDA